MLEYDRRWQHNNDRDTLPNFNDASFDTFKVKIGLFSEFWNFEFNGRWQHNNNNAKTGSGSSFDRSQYHNNSSQKTTHFLWRHWRGFGDKHQDFISTGTLSQKDSIKINRPGPAGV